ncbi:Uncharacterised protein [Salmonella enterica subsp. arizonae]|nr:Uncharacterised protein [Salmonella enterica subsp. arizonae]
MPLQIKDIIDLQTLVESEQVEFKLAGGERRQRRVTERLLAHLFRNGEWSGRLGSSRCKRTGWKNLYQLVLLIPKRLRPICLIS